LKAPALAVAGGLSRVYGSTPAAVNRETLLDELERRACRFFWEHSNPETGLVLDRAPADGSRGPNRVASIAATGFGLSAHCIAESRGFLEPANARARVERSLTWLARQAQHKNGFLHHFVDAASGERAFRSEVSSIDTAWLLCGVIHARQHFAASSMDRLAAEILDRVDWRWMLAGGDTLSHGWTPERGFLPYRWDAYSELMAMYLLAIGASESPIPATSWQAGKRPNSSGPGDS
jgi:hypothetical protein